MSTPILLPPPTEVAQRMRDCRAELESLRKLLRASRAAYEAAKAKGRRAPTERGAAK